MSTATEFAEGDIRRRVPRFEAENLAANEEILKRYATLIYAVNERPNFGSFDPARIAAVGRFYLDHGIVQKAVPVEDTYTNDFVAK